MAYRILDTTSTKSPDLPLPTRPYLARGPVWPGMVRLLRYLQTVLRARVRPHGGSSYSGSRTGPDAEERRAPHMCVVCPGPVLSCTNHLARTDASTQPPFPLPSPTFPRYRRPTSSYDFIVTGSFQTIYLLVSYRLKSVGSTCVIHYRLIAEFPKEYRSMYVLR